MTKKTKAERCLELVHTNIYGSFCVYAWIVWVFHHFTDKYSRFRYICIGNLIPWIYSLNLRQGRITYWVHIPRTSIGSKWCV